MTHNKANKSKILALILGLTMCLALMLGIVFASPTFAVYAEGGTGTTGGLTIDDAVDITASDGTYAYSAASKTLMLNGYNGGVIRFTADNYVTVNLVNGSTNTITLNDSAITEDQYGVYAAGNLTVTGKGTFNINMDISGAGDEITTEYGELKEKLALRYPYDVDGYYDEKEEFVKQLERDTLKWYTVKNM
ncbi:MAG: hypothetical protein SOY33_03690 [Candidatus Onthovivens sp.]|nr:hypothetical protein [Erysipelotrichaceae bacterium]MDD7622143.1 hypothetical protein [Bacilli bacterium]